ncbi:hypothetical protein BH09ACT12_BH09ACT12_26350 [soil metagenome]
MDDIAPSQSQKLIAEALGTAVLVIVGFTSGNALGFGVALFALVLAFGRVSGGHFNPAVSVGVAISGRMAWKDAVLYAAAQVGGAIAGGVVLLVISLTSSDSYEFGDPLFAGGYGDQGGSDLLGALFLVLAVSFAFVLLVVAITDERTEFAMLAPLGIGLAYAGAAYGLIDATGSVANPAVTFSTVFFSGADAIAQAWLFVLVPLVGAALAGLLHPAVFGRVGDAVPGSGLNLASRKPAATGYDTNQWAGQSYGQDYGQDYGQAQQPIIQDGWQWDPQAQQWIPAQQQAPAPPAQQGWSQPGDGDSGTQVRPPS